MKKDYVVDVCGVGKFRKIDGYSFVVEKIPVEILDGKQKLKWVYDASENRWVLKPKGRKPKQDK